MAFLATSCMAHFFLITGTDHCNSVHTGNESIAGTQLVQEEPRGAVCPVTKPQSRFSWYKASLSLSHKDTGKEGSWYQFCFVCSRILMLFPCYLLKAASENRKGKVTQRTGPFMLEPTQMEDCQMYRSQIKSNRSTLNLCQASWRNFSKNFTFHKDLCFNRYLQFPFKLQISSTFLPFPAELLHICSIIFLSLNNKDKSQIILQECQNSCLKIKSYPIQMWTRVFPEISEDTV